MDLAEWDERYRAEAGSQQESPPTSLVVEVASRLKPARALDLACGTGRNALWLAERGWSVTAVDGSPAAIDILNKRAAERGLKVDARVVDLEHGGYTIERPQWKLILSCYYLQRDLLELAKRGVVPGGVMIVIGLLAEAGRKNAPYRLQPGELRGYFQGWEILHDCEGKSAEAIHQHAVAEIVARRPNSNSI
jgi:tellurite methyltransferase